MTPRCISLALAALAIAAAAHAQTPALDRDAAHVMLQTAQRDLHRLYYDTTFGGHNLDSLVRVAEARIDSAPDNTARFGVIAQVLFALDDSHTSFWPPNRVAQVEYGFGVTAIGDSCYVEAVDPASDAWAKGLRPGDFLYAVERRRVGRADLWKLSYLLRGLAPRTSLELMVASPHANGRVVRIASRVRERPRVLDLTHGEDFWNLVRGWENDEPARRSQFALVGDVLIWRLPTFVMEDEDIQEALNRARAHEALILDLRHNHGGWVDAVRLLAGGLLGRDTIIGFVHKRTETDTVRTRGAPHFEGRLVVLTDEESASGSEVTAGIVHLFRRGTIVGDRSMGALMTSIGVPEQVGSLRAVPFAFSITISDYLLPDGTRLEKVGVAPDELVLANGEDLATGRDPALARALELLGQPTTSAAAGRLLPPRPTAALLWKSY